MIKCALKIFFWKPLNCILFFVFFQCCYILKHGIVSRSFLNIQIMYKMNYIYTSHTYCPLQLGEVSFESVLHGLLMTQVSLPRLRARCGKLQTSRQEATDRNVWQTLLRLSLCKHYCHRERNFHFDMFREVLRFRLYHHSVIWITVHHMYVLWTSFHRIIVQTIFNLLYFMLFVILLLNCEF